MKKQLVFLIILFSMAMGGAALAYVILPGDSTIEAEPAPVFAVSATATASPTTTPTWTFTPSSTPTATITSSPTATTTLGVRVEQAVIIMPDVMLPPTSTLLPDDLQILAEPPEPIEPLPNATLLPFPYIDFTDWVAFESDHPVMRYIQGNWTPIGSLQASQGQYHYSEDTDAKMSLTFSGEAVRVRYVGFTNGGVWNVLIDGEVVDTIDSYALIGTFTGFRARKAGINQAGENGVKYAALRPR